MNNKTRPTIFAFIAFNKLFVSGIFITFLLVFFGHTLFTQAQTEKQPLIETLNVSFKKYQAVKTTAKYSGNVLIVVSGVGQASGKDYTDAFYRYTNAGTPLDHPVNANEFGLQIDGIQSNKLLKDMPDYGPDHIYVFTYDAGQTLHTIGFSIGETGLADNTGKFTVRVVPLS